MKKLLVLLLTLLLSINCFSVKTTYAEDSLVYKNQKNEILLGDSGDIIPPEIFDVLTRIDPEANCGLINAIQSVSKIGTAIGGIFNAYNGVMNFLKSLGIIKDPQQQFQREVISKLNEINNTTKQMNEKLDNVTNNLERYFSEASQRFDKQEVILYRQNIQSFITNYEEKMDNRMSSFGHTIDSKFKLWFDNAEDKTITVNAGIYLYDRNEEYNEDSAKERAGKSFQVTVSDRNFREIVATKKYSWNSSSYSLDLENLYAEFCKQGIQEAKDFNMSGPISIERTDLYETGLFNWMTAYINEHTSNQTYKFDYQSGDINNIMSGLHYYLFTDDSATISERDGSESQSSLLDEMAQCFGQHCVQYLGTNFYKEICDEGNGTSAQYINDVCNEFQNYCNILKNGVNSPMINQLNIIFKTNCFQSEAIGDINNVRDYYIGSLTKYASFYLGIMKQCDISNYDYYVNLYAETANTLLGYYKNSVVLDDEKRVITNYCYITNSPLRIKTADLTQTMKINHEEWENNFGMEYDAYTGYENESWNLNIGANQMADNDDLLMISALYKQLGNGKTFMEYIESNTGEKVGSHKDIPYFITKFDGTKEFNLSDRKKLNVSKVGRGTYFEDYDTFDVNSGGEDDLENEYFYIHDSAVASVFDVNTLKNNNSFTLESRALYAEAHGSWRRDEKAFFTDSGKSWNDYYIHIDANKYDERDEHYYYKNTCYTSSCYYFISKGSTEQEISISADILGGLEGIVPNGIENEIVDDTPMSYYVELDDFKPYVLYADETKYFDGNPEHDQKVYEGFESYVNNPDVIIDMTDAYYEKAESLFKNKDLNEGTENVSFSASQIEKIVDEITKYYAPEGISELKNAEILTENQSSYTLKGKKETDKSVTFPKKAATNLKVNVVVAYMPVYKLDCKDANGFSDNIDDYMYEIINDYFNVKPFLFWEENDETKFVPIENKIIKNLNLEFDVKIPVSKEVDGTNKAIVNHHASNQDTSEIYETFTGTLYGNKGERYVQFKTKSFSPFSVDRCFKEESPSPSPSPSHNYSIPTTGIK